MLLCYALSRCQEVEGQNKLLEQELKNTNEQLMLAVQQKFKLHQQIEAWQVSKTLY